MILDNENQELKVHEWITKYTEEGKIDIVTGYFTIGALAYLSKQVNDKISDFRMYPNPIYNNGTLHIKLNNLFNSDIDIRIYNIEGRQVFTKSTNALDGTLSMNINLKASGVYFVKVISNELIMTKKLVVY